MTQFRFAFFVMSGDYRPEKIHARFSIPGCETLLYGVPSVEAACALARRLAADGTVPRIELCGAFGPEGARQVIQRLVYDGELFSLTPLLAPDPFHFILASGAAGWGGVSVLCQTLAVLDGSGLRVRNCLLGKAAQGGISLLLAALLAGYVL